MDWMPCLVMSKHRGSEVERISLGNKFVDDYLAFVGARVRPNSWLAAGFDLKVFFAAVPKEPAEVTPADILGFIEAQRAPRAGSKVVRLEDGERGLSARTIKRRLATVSGFYAYLLARGDAGVTANPVPRGIPTRRPHTSARQRGVPLIRAPRTLPRVLSPAEVDAFVGALRTHRDRAMARAMLLGGLRRCEVLGLRLSDLRPAEHRLFIAEGKGGHQRIVPISGRFFEAVGDYLDRERPRTSSTDQLFVVLKGSGRGRPLSAAGLDEIVRGARARAGIRQLTCHQLRHTCFTRLREAGMALEALQARRVTGRSRRPGSTCTSRTTGWPASTGRQRRRSRRAWQNRNEQDGAPARARGGGAAQLVRGPPHEVPLQPGGRLPVCGSGVVAPLRWCRGL